MKRFKKIAVALISLAMIAIMAIPSFAVDAVTTVAVEAVKQPLNLTVVHTNDVHSHIGDGMDVSRVAGYVKSLRDNGENVLFLDAGDFIQGTPLASLYQGYSAARILDSMEYDAQTIGNHEFDYGYDRFKKLETYVKSPYLNSNVIDKRTGEKIAKEYIVKEFDGYKVGVFGLIADHAGLSVLPENVVNVEFLSAVENAKRVVELLKTQEKCDYIIALGHVGLDEGGKVTSKQICEEVEGIDLFVDGHSHTSLEKGMEVGDSLIVQTGSNSTAAGVVEIAIDASGNKTEAAQLLCKDAISKFPYHNNALYISNFYIKGTVERTSEVIGKTDVKLDGAREIVRAGESNLARLCAQALLNATDGAAQIAFNNGGNVRVTIEPGEITYGDAISVMPFGNTVFVMEIKGKDIISALEMGVSKYPEASGGFLHPAGMRYSFDPSKPVGSRIVSATLLDGTALANDTTYKVAINNFLATGGDGIFPKGLTKLFDLCPEEEALIDFIKNNMDKLDDTEHVTIVK